MTSPEIVIQKMVNTYDVQGTAGCQHYSPRVHLMVELTSCEEIDGTLHCKMTQFAAEGFGAMQYGSTHLTIPADREFQTEVPLVVKTLHDHPPLHKKIWLWNVADVDEVSGQLQMVFQYDDKSNWGVVPDPTMESPVRVLELFSGGFAGWKAALAFIAEHTDIQHQSIAVDHNYTISKIYASTHYANWAPTHAQLGNDFPGTDDWILNNDFRAPKLLRPLTEWMPHVVTLSAPCPPWSGANGAEGLSGMMECCCHRPYFCVNG